MVMVLSDVILPNSVLAAGVRGKNMRRNQRASNQAGYMQANVVWARTLRKYDLGTVPMTVAQWQTVEGLHEVTEGGAYGLLMEDPKDARVAAPDGLLQPYGAANLGSIGLGYGVPAYRAHKRYTSAGSSRYKDRRISRLKTSAITRGGVAVTLGAGAGQVAVDNNTGLITFVADASQALSSVSVGASTTLNFADGSGIVAALAVGQRVYLTGITGTAAATLNSLSHAITAKGATSLTIGTATTGLTAAAGTAYKYPQASEALAWTGGFYVPVQFESDEIDYEVVRAGDYDSRLIQGLSVMLVEVME